MLSEQQIQLIIDAQNRTAAAFQGVERALGELQRRVEGFNAAAARGAREASSGFSGVGSALSGLLGVAERAFGGILGLLRSVAGAVLDLAGKIAGALVGAFETLLGIAARVGGVLGGVLVAGMVALGKAGIDMHVVLDQANSALTRITGSAEGAKNLIAQLKAESLTSALTFKELVIQGQSLAAAWGPEGIGKVVPTVRAFGDAAATLGVQGDGLSRALLGFRQLITRAVPTQEDVNQIAENLPGVNVTDILLKKFGTGDLDALRKANVTGRQIGEAIVAGLQESFGGAQVSQANKIPILLSNIQDAFNNVSDAVVARFAPMLEHALGRFLELIQGLASNQRIIDGLSVPFELLGRALEYVADHAQEFIGWLEGVLSRENVIDIIASIGATLQTVTAEVERFFGAVGGTGGGNFTSMWDGFKEAARGALDLAIRLWGAFTAGVTFLVDNRAEIWGAIKDGVTEVGNAIKDIAENLKPVFEILKWIVSNSGLLRELRGHPGVVQSGMGFPGFAGVSAEAYSRQFVGKGMPTDSGAAAQAGQALGAMGGALTGGGQPADPWGRLQSLGERGWAAIQQGYQARGADDLIAEWQARQAATRQALSRALTPAAAGAPRDPGDPLPPRLGAGPHAAGPVAMTPEQIKELQKQIEDMRKATNAAIGAQLEMAKVVADAGPEETRAQAEATALIPLLREKQEEITVEARGVAQDSKEYADAVKEYWQVEGEINSLQQRAQKEHVDGLQKAVDAVQRQAQEQKRAQDEAKRQAAEARQVIDLQMRLAQAKMENDPFLTPQQRQQALLPYLFQKFGSLNRTMTGETQTEALQRLIDAEQTRKAIVEASGIFGPGGPQFGRMFGGGQIPLFDTRRASGLYGELDRVAAQAASMGPMGGGAAAGGPRVLNLQIAVNDLRTVGRVVQEQLDQQAYGAYPGPWAVR